MTRHLLRAAGIEQSGTSAPASLLLVQVRRDELCEKLVEGRMSACYQSPRAGEGRAVQADDDRGRRCARRRQLVRLQKLRSIPQVVAQLVGGLELVLFSLVRERWDIVEVMYGHGLLVHRPDASFHGGKRSLANGPTLAAIVPLQDAEYDVVAP